MDASKALALWVSEGQIDADLAQRLRSSLDAHDEPERTNKIIWVLVSIGAVLTGGGLLLLIASQWDQSSPLRRLALLFAIYLLTIGAAAFAERQQLGTTARGLWFLSSIAVGVNIFLVGQVFNLPLTYWQGTLLWMVATLVMGWASPSSAQGWLAVPLGVLTLGWITVPDTQFFEQQAFLFEPAGLRPLLPMVGLALAAAAMLVDGTEFEWLKRAATAFAAALVAVPIVVSTFVPNAFGWFFQIDVRAFHFVVAVGALALVGLAWRRDRRSPLGWAAMMISVLLVAVLPQVKDTAGDFDGDTTSWLAPVFNASELAFGVYTALIFALAVATIVAGQFYAVPGLVNAGFAVVSVQLFAVYIGRIAGALPTSLAVIVGGLVLIGGATMLERKRRDALSAVTTGAPA